MAFFSLLENIYKDMPTKNLSTYFIILLNAIQIVSAFTKAEIAFIKSKSNGCTLLLLNQTRQSLEGLNFAVIQLSDIKDVAKLQGFFQTEVKCVAAVTSYEDLMMTSQEYNATYLNSLKNMLARVPFKWIYMFNFSKEMQLKNVGEAIWKDIVVVTKDEIGNHNHNSQG